MALVLRILFVCALSPASVTLAQGILMHTPEKPQPGDTVTVTYTPGKTGTIGISAYMCGSKTSPYQEIDLLPEESAGSYRYSIPTDSSTTLIFFSISVGKQIDNNNGEGFWIQLYNDTIPVKNSFFNLATFYAYYQGPTGHRKSDYIRSLEASERELALYPDNFIVLHSIIDATRHLNPDKVNQLLTTEETRVRSLQPSDERSYIRLINLYSNFAQPNEKLTNEMRTLFPQGQWRMHEKIDRYFRETNSKKRDEQYHALMKQRNELKKIPGGEWLLNMENAHRIEVELNRNNWSLFQKLMSEHSFQDVSEQSGYYNRAAIAILESKRSNLKQAEKFAQLALHPIEKTYNKAVSRKRSYIRISELGELYADCADTYAIILDKQKKYAQALPLARKAAIDLMNGTKSEFNNTYVLIAAKAVPTQQLLSEIEKFILNWSFNPDIVETFQTVYKKVYPAKSDFDSYFQDLKTRSLTAYSDSIRQKITNLPAASFNLTNMEDKNVN